MFGQYEVYLPKILSSISFNLLPFCSFILAAAEAARRSVLRSSVLFRRQKHRQQKRMKTIAARGVSRITKNMSRVSS